MKRERLMPIKVRTSALWVRVFLAGFTVCTFHASGQSAKGTIAGYGTAQARAVGNIPPIPVFTITDFSTAFPPAFLSNGVIGIRLDANPLKPSARHEAGKPRPPGDHPVATVVAGFVRAQPKIGVESMAPAPNPLVTDITVKGVSLLGHPEMVQIHRQSLDLANGELSTEMSFRPSVQEDIEITVVQFASRSVPALLCQQIVLRSSSAARLELETTIDRTGIPGTVFLDKAPYDDQDIDRVMGFENGGTKLGIALVVPSSKEHTRKASGKYVVEAQVGKSYKFQTLAALVSEAYSPDPHFEAIRLARWGEMLGFDQLREQNRKAWVDLWRGRVKVYGDPESQRALDTAFFYLMSNTHAGALTGTPPFGYSQYEAYDGHVFWDMDAFMVPPLIVLAPEAAKAMLEYRLRGLSLAQKRSRLFGYQGAMFPWEAGIDGADVSPTGAATGWAEQHIVPDVAIAFWEYGEATGDKDFIQRAVWPILQNTAQWITSRGEFTKRGFEIKNLMGVDESVGNISNAAQMNLACRLVMKAAINEASTLGIVAPSVWQHIADTIVVTVDPRSGAVLPYDGARPGREYSVDMLPLLFLHALPTSSVEYKQTFNFEQKIAAAVRPTPSVPCTNEAPGFTCPPIAASEAYLGNRRRAAELFRQSWQPYWVEPFGLTKEYAKYSDGDYVTNHGSLLMSVIFGFTGLRISAGDWHQYPATLPEGWQRVEVDRIWIQGKPMRLIAENGKQTQLLEEK